MYKVERIAHEDELFLSLSRLKGKRMNELIKRLKYYYCTFSTLAPLINSIEKINLIKQYQKNIENELKALKNIEKIKEPEFIIKLIPLNIEVYNNFIKSILTPMI